MNDLTGPVPIDSAPSVAIRVPDDDRANDVITELARLGVVRSAIFIAVRSKRRLERLVESTGASPLRSAIREVGVLAEFSRLSGSREEAEPGAFERELCAHGVDRERASMFARELDETAVVLVLPGSLVDSERLRSMISLGADVGLANRAGYERTISLRREILDVTKRVVRSGEVAVRREVVRELRSIEVELEREEFVIEYRDLLAEGTPVTTTRIPLRYEEADVRIETVVAGEVLVRTEMSVDRSVVGETVRHEVLYVDDAREPQQNP